MGSGAVDLVVAGQIVRVRGEYDDVAAICRKRQLSADDGMREVLDVDGERVVFNIAAVGLIRKAQERQARGAFGFSRALEEGVKRWERIGFSAAAQGALSKRDAERQARELRKAGKAARVARKGQSGWQVIIDGERSQ